MENVDIVEREACESSAAAHNAPMRTVFGTKSKAAGLLRTITAIVAGQVQRA